MSDALIQTDAPAPAPAPAPVPAVPEPQWPGRRVGAAPQVAAAQPTAPTATNADGDIPTITVTPEPTAKPQQAWPGRKVDDPVKMGPADSAAGLRIRSPQNIPLGKAADAITGKAEDVDYESGLSFMDRSFLARMDNDAEKTAYLESRYGKDSVSADDRGRMVVKAPGQAKKTAIDAGGFLSGLGADLTGNAYPLIGATAGAVLGAPAGPAGVIGGSMLGGTLGKGLDEALKEGQGFRRKSPYEEATTLRNAGLFMGGGEAAGMGLKAGAKRVMQGRLPEFLSHVDPETERMTALTLRGGAVPPVRSALPGARRLQWKQAFSTKAVGEFTDQEHRNAEFVRNELRDVLRESGVPEAHLEQVLTEVLNPTAAVSTRALGQDIQTAVRAHADTLRSLSKQDMDQAGALLDQRLHHLNTLTRRFQTGSLGVDVAAGIEQARKDFGTAASKIYSRIDRLVGDEPLVPSTAIKRTAQRVYDSIPKTAETPGTPPGVQRVMEKTPRGQIWRTEETPGTPGGGGNPVLGDPRVLKVLGDLRQLPELVSFKDAQRIRTTLAEIGEMNDLTPGVTHRNFDDLRQSVNTAFSVAELDPRAESALALKHVADDWYRTNIKKFTDATVNKLVRDTQSGMAPDPSVIARTVLQPGQSARASQLKAMLPAEVWHRVAGADFDNLISAATKSVDGSDVVKGSALLAQIEKRGGIFDITYGQKLAGEIRDYARRLATRDGDMPLSGLTLDNFGASLMRANQRADELNAFLKQNFLGALADPKKMPDDALRWIVQPQQEERLVEAINFFREGSPQVQAIRQAALRDLLSKAISTTETGVGKQVAGGGIEDALRQFTAKQQELLFPHGLGDDIRLVAKEARFLFPASAGSDMSAGLAAGAIKALPLMAYAPLAVPIGFTGWLLSRPGVIRYLSIGLQGGGAAREATLDSMRVMARMAALGMAPDEGGTPSQ